MSTILILWFAGVSRHGRSDQHRAPVSARRTAWRRSGPAPSAPVVLVYTLTSIGVTIAFDADVDAQAGAYATGILAMMVSGAVAVTISAARRRQRLRHRRVRGPDRCCCCYALVENIREKPDGITISGLFIAGHHRRLAHLPRLPHHRAARRAHRVRRRCPPVRHRLPRPRRGTSTSSPTSGRPATPPSTPPRRPSSAAMNPVPGRADVLFLEIDVIDPSGFSDVLTVRACRSTATGSCGRTARRSPTPSPRSCSRCATRPASGRTAYFEWAEGDPLGHLFRYLLFGRGDTAPVVREIIRRSEPDPAAPSRHSRWWLRGRALPAHPTSACALGPQVPGFCTSENWPSSASEARATKEKRQRSLWPVTPRSRLPCVLDRRYLAGPCRGEVLEPRTIRERP